MLLISVIIVVMFVWLIFNHPFKQDRESPDTYEYYLQMAKEKEQKTGKYEI